MIFPCFAHRTHLSHVAASQLSYSIIIYGFANKNSIIVTVPWGIETTVVNILRCGGTFHLANGEIHHKTIVTYFCQTY